MAILDFLKAPKKAPPHAQISELEERLQRVVAERHTLEALVESHSATRAAMVYEADKSEEDILAFDRELDVARLKLERAELVELELLDRIAHARNSDARSRKAGELERAAETIAAKTAPLDAAASAFAAAYRELLSAVPADLVDIRILKPRFSVDGAATPVDIASAIAAQALAASCPELFETHPPHVRVYGNACAKTLSVLDADTRGRLSPVLPGESGEHASITSAEKAAARFVVDPLRDKARALRGSAEMKEAAE